VGLLAYLIKMHTTLQCIQEPTVHAVLKKRCFIFNVNDFFFPWPTALSIDADVAN